MGYEAALKKAWDALGEPAAKSCYLKFFDDEYRIDYGERNIISARRETPARDYYKLLLLHYLANENRVPEISGGGWISFKELEGGEVYFPAFRKRAIEPILKKYGDRPADIFSRAMYFDSKKMDTGSAGVSIKAFPKVNIAVILWAKDDEFSADCSILFNKEAKEILPTEDLSVLGGILASLI